MAEHEMQVPYTYTLPQQFVEDKEVPTRWRVWAVINGFFIGGQYCWASNEWLAKKVKSHKDTVSQAVKELEEMNIIKCVRRARGRDIYPMIGANAYQWSASTPISDRHQRLSISYSVKSEKEITSADEPRIERVSSEENPKPSAKPKYPHSKEVFALWASAPKNWVLNTTQLRAAENLYEEQGIEEIKAALEYIEKHRHEDFFPQIASPYDLDSKWDKLSAFYDKKHA